MNNIDYLLRDFFINYFMRYAPIAVIVLWLFGNIFKAVMVRFLKREDKFINSSNWWKIGLGCLFLIFFLLFIEIVPFAQFIQLPSFIDIIFTIIRVVLLLSFWGFCLFLLIILGALGHASGAGAPPLQKTIEQLLLIFKRNPKTNKELTKNSKTGMYSERIQDSKQNSGDIHDK